MSESQGELGFGFMLSTSVHVALVLVGVFGGPLFDADEEEALNVVEATFISSEDFAAIAAGPAPTPDPEEIEPQALVAPPPEPEPEPEIEEQPPEPAPPEPEEAVVEPPPEPPVEEPLEVAKAPDEAPRIVTPDQLAVDPDAVREDSGEAALRETLPRPEIKQASVLENPDPRDEPAEIDTNSEEPPEPQPKRVRKVETPAQPVVENRDQQPAPDEPDAEPPAKAEETPPETEIAAVEPPPPAEPPSIAPEKAQKPRRRPQPPRRAPAPEAVEEIDLASRIGEALEQVGGSQARVVARAPVVKSPRTGPPLTGAEIDGLRFRLRDCWSPPLLGGVQAKDLTVTLYIKLAIDGRLASTPILARPDALFTTRQEAAFRKAVSALQNCAPFDQLPRSKYGQWDELYVTFDPESPLGIQ